MVCMVMNEPTRGESLDVEAGRRAHMLMWDRGMTQLALGRLIGMDQSALAKRLRGRRGWTLDQIAAVATALDTTIAYLMGEINDPKCTPRDLNPEPTDSGFALVTPIRRVAA